MFLVKTNRSLPPPLVDHDPWEIFWGTCHIALSVCKWWDLTGVGNEKADLGCYAVVLIPPLQQQKRTQTKLSKKIPYDDCQVARSAMCVSRKIRNKINHVFFVSESKCCRIWDSQVSFPPHMEDKGSIGVCNRSAIDRSKVLFPKQRFCNV